MAQDAGGHAAMPVDSTTPSHVGPGADLRRGAPQSDPPALRNCGVMVVYNRLLELDPGFREARWTIDVWVYAAFEVVTRIGLVRIRGRPHRLEYGRLEHL